MSSRPRSATCRCEPARARNPAQRRPDRLRGHAHHAHAARAPRHRHAHRRAARAQRAPRRRRADRRAARGQDHRAGQRRRHAGAVRSGRLAGGRSASRRHPREPAARAERRGRGALGLGLRRAALPVRRLPARRRARAAQGARGARVPWPVVFYEAPHRIAETLERPARALRRRRARSLIGRELTKKFEEVARLPLGAAAAWLAARAATQPGRVRAGARAGAEQRAAGRRRCRRGARASCSRRCAPSEAARLAARITGAPKNLLYRKALERAK